MRAISRIDLEVIRKAQKGDEQAFEQIVFAYERSIFSFIGRLIGGSRADAEDLTQETFVKLYVNLAKYDDTKNFDAWLFTIARHVTYDWFRKKRNQKEVYVIDDPDRPYDPPYKNENGNELYELRGEYMDIEQALSQLSPKYKEVLLLYYWKGFSYAEISEILHAPINTVKTKMRRARTALEISYNGNTKGSRSQVYR